MRNILIALLALVAVTAPAQAAPDHSLIAETALEQHILPASRAFKRNTDLYVSTTAQCFPERLPDLQAGYGRLWDSWLGLSIYRFGPVETDNRALSIAFWPDKKGFTPRALRSLIATADPVIDDPGAFASSSIAGRGLLALEWLLFEDGNLAPYQCRLIGAIAADLSRTANRIDAEWNAQWATIFTSAGMPDNTDFRSEKEATQRLVSALVGALDETIDLRLARPLGTLEEAHPRRAEAWRSERSLPNIAAVLSAVQNLTQRTFYPHITEELQEELDLAFGSSQSALVSAQKIAPLSGAVVTSDRIRIDGLQAALIGLRDIIVEALGPQLGVSQGFNARDGD